MCRGVSRTAPAVSRSVAGRRRALVDAIAASIFEGGRQRPTGRAETAPSETTRVLFKVAMARPTPRPKKESTGRAAGRVAAPAEAALRCIHRLIVVLS